MIPKPPTTPEFNEWLNAIFAPTPLTHANVHEGNAVIAFENLTYYFISQQYSHNPSLCEKILGNTRIDIIGVTAMIKKFQRDAHGVRKFGIVLESWVKSKGINAAAQESIMKEIGHLGLRITTHSPRKTREAAAFTMWMCVYRPVTFDAAALTELSGGEMEEFCAKLNFFIASSYLSKFGEIVLGKSRHEISVRTERIRRDFTCRQVCQSTLEVFYGAILRPNPKYLKYEDEEVETPSSSKKKPRKNSGGLG